MPAAAAVSNYPHPRNTRTYGQAIYGILQTYALHIYTPPSRPTRLNDVIHIIIILYAYTDTYIYIYIYIQVRAKTHPFEITHYVFSE